MNDAIGIIEMFGFVTAITAADAAAKAADVKVIASAISVEMTNATFNIIE